MNANNIFFQKSITNSELGGLKSNWQIEVMDAANSDNSLKKMHFFAQQRGKNRIDPFP